MTAGLSSRARRRQKHGRRRLEYLLLIAGLLALDYYIWANAGAWLAQAYDHWVFAKELQTRPAPAAPRPVPAAPRLAPLALVGRMEIPRLQVNLMVREGVTQETLRRAVGHVPMTALPGQPGNVALAAHRDTFFRPLRNIRKGDLITVDTLSGSYQYQVESTQVVLPRDTQVLNASNQPELTLITCYPFNYVGSAPKRFIVRAVQIGASAAPAARSAL
jgi:sortase A